MKSHIVLAYHTFLNGCSRAEGLKSIFEYLKKTGPIALQCDDILRSSLVLAVSSFDLYIHDVFRLEVLHRSAQKNDIYNLKIPFNVLIKDESLQLHAIGEYLRKENSHKSFVAPDKLAECLKCFVPEPWDQIASVLAQKYPSSKTKLKQVIDLRNRIAHEADVNPSYGGVELWPIYVEDVESSISFLRQLGKAIATIASTTSA